MARRVNYRDVIHNQDDPATEIKIFKLDIAFKSGGYQCSGTRRVNCKDNLCAIALLIYVSPTHASTGGILLVTFLLPTWM